ncbi:MAG: hypothetical protein ACJ8BF_12050 [Gemmatimonadales bacterium]
MRSIPSSPDQLQRARRYLLGMGGIALLSSGLVAFAPPAWRTGLWVALGLALAVQLPLGTWLLRSLGSDRFLAVWVLGMLMRLVLVGVAGLVLYPAFHWPAAPGLVSLVLILMASLALEGLVLLLEFREGDAR